MNIAHKQRWKVWNQTNLRAVKTFLNWCHKRDLIQKCPYVDMVSKPKEMPLYVPDRIFNKILELDWLKDHYKNAFLILS